MFVPMKRLVLAALVLSSCRPGDGGSRSTPSSTASASGAVTQSAPTAQAGPTTPAATDSARDNALLERADAARIQGTRTAPVWLVEISDFQCPFCKRFHDETYPIIKREFIDPGHVRMAYVNLPLSMHANALPAAEAAMCAAAQDRFWQMHDALFATQQRWGPMEKPGALIDSLAVSVEVNPTEWRECMRSGIMRRLVNGDVARAGTSGARSTPVFFVDNEPIHGAAPIGVFRAAIERARAKTAGRTPP